MILTLGQTVQRTGLTYKVHSISDDRARVQLVNPDGLYVTAPVNELSSVVTITYFKTSGKYYTEDEDAVWPTDENHFTGWKPFSEVVRLKDMFAVCMESPLGYPQFAYPRHTDSLEHIEDVVSRIRQEPPTPRASCPRCKGTCLRCGHCKATGLVATTEENT